MLFDLKKERAALQFSGGKDSLACLFFLREHWDDLTVYWTNTGATFPETVALMEKVRAMVPSFVEIKTDQPANIAEMGWPVDVLPILSSPAMRPLHTKPRLKLQSFLGCCHENIMRPMHDRMREDGITLIIRGQRKEDVNKNPVRPTDTENGMRCWFPIEDWTGEQVRDYLGKQEIGLPENYQEMDTSLDCWNCTGFLEHNIGKRRYMKKNHPEAYALVSEMLTLIAQETERDIAYLKEAIET